MIQVNIYMIKNMKTNKSLRLYYYDGIAANSKEELRKQIQEGIKDDQYRRYTESDLNDMCKKIKHITLDRDSVYLILCQYYEDIDIKLFNAQDLFDEANEMFKYVGYLKSYGCISILKSVSNSHDLECVLSGLNKYSIRKYWEDNDEEDED